jgi:hypothetical protein
MNGTIAALFLAGALGSPGDTLIEVGLGAQLHLPDLGGSVVVETWDRMEVLAEADAKDPVTFRVLRSGNRVEIRAGKRGDEDVESEFRFVIPTWMEVAISGKELDVVVRDLSGDLTIRSLSGDLSLRDLSGSVDAYAAEGEIDAHGLRGSARLRTGDDDIMITESTAFLDLETIEGKIVLVGIRGPGLSARTTDGDIEFSGSLGEGGSYGFYTHGGDIRIHPLPPVGVDATVLSYEGKFTSDFPIRAKRFRSGENLEFTLGAGGARLIIETFEGEIRLLRDRGGS